MATTDGLTRATTSATLGKFEGRVPEGMGIVNPGLIGVDAVVAVISDVVFGVAVNCNNLQPLVARINAVSTGTIIRARVLDMKLIIPVVTLFQKLRVNCIVLKEGWCLPALLVNEKLFLDSGYLGQIG
jgi:hypothetical protein